MKSSYSNTHASALIVEGGAMRSVFSAGLLDGFIEGQFNPFDFYIGVSAGAYNLITYSAGLFGVSLHVFRDLATSSHFINYTRFIRGGHLLDLDWLVQTSLRESKSDPRSIYHHAKPLYICVTDVGTGQAVYVKTTPDNIENVIKASTALPLIYRDFPLINARPMTDGGISDGIPVAEAIRMGAKRIMVIRSRHRDYVKTDSLWHKFIRWKLKTYPALTQTMRERVERFESVLQQIRNPPHGVQILEICPPPNFTIGRFNRNRKDLQQGYETGFNLANGVIRQWLAL